jgi:hypothetical protein
MCIPTVEAAGWKKVTNLLVPPDVPVDDVKILRFAVLGSAVGVTLPSTNDVVWTWPKDVTLNGAEAGVAAPA